MQNKIHIFWRTVASMHLQLFGGYILNTDANSLTLALL